MRSICYDQKLISKTDRDSMKLRIFPKGFITASRTSERLAMGSYSLTKQEEGFSVTCARPDTIKAPSVTANIKDFVRKQGKLYFTIVIFFL